jgi:hypothetical protein
MAPSINEKENEKVVGGSDATSPPEDAVVNAEGGDTTTPGEEGEIEGSWGDYKVINSDAKPWGGNILTLPSVSSHMQALQSISCKALLSLLP